MGAVDAEHRHRMHELRKLAPHLKFVEIRECEFNARLHSDPEFAAFINNVEIKDRLLPRNALFGGRTEVFQLFHECQADEQIRYVDFTSLYPWAQKYGTFPLGHPSKIQTENFLPEENYYGLIFCKVLPPQKLHIPLLPARINNKLTFTLCRTCAMLQSTELCMHSDEERALEGTWVSLELDKAVELGYKVLKYYEVWHWDKTDAEIGGLFTMYVNKAMKSKQEASGYPDGVETEEEKQQYIDGYYRDQGIQLDKDKIEKNPGRRTVAKLMANNQWGFLAMKPNKTMHMFVNDTSTLYQMLSDKQYSIEHIDISHDDIIQLFYTINEEMFTGSTNTNVVLAAFVTAIARLRLFAELVKIGNRVLYCDTDSIIYISKPGFYDPPLGNNLGDLTNEVEPPSKFIQSFITTGEKSYAYKTDQGKVKIVSKGITQHSVANTMLTYEVIDEIVRNDRSIKVSIPQLNFSKDKKDWAVRTDVKDKQFGFTSNKRIIHQDYTTSPYGYKY